MRSANRLYRLQIAIATAAAAVVLAATTTVLAGASLATPSSEEVADACSNWISEGGPAALLGLAILVLAGTAVGFGARSLWRQTTASRHYLRSLPSGGDAVVEGTRCRLVELDEPLAFCAGNLRPRIFVSQGTLERLTPVELRAVLAHEGHHAHRRDPLRRLLASALADSLFFVPILRRISDRYRDLGEVAADEAALASVADRRSLASALLKFSEVEPVPAVAGVHPERVDHLMGDSDSAGWRLPLSSVGRSVLALWALSALVLLIWQGVLDPTLEAPLVLAAACMTAMVGGPVLLAGMTLLVSARALRGRRA